MSAEIKRDPVTERLLELLGDKPAGHTEDGLPIFPSEQSYKVDASRARGVYLAKGKQIPFSGVAAKCREVLARNGVSEGRRDSGSRY